MASPQKPQKTSRSPAKTSPAKTPFAANTRLHILLVAAFAFLLYAQTLTFDYAADDGMVILGHRVVQKGFAGIPELLTSDSFRGLDEAEGRTDTRRTYRPLSFITFAVEYQFFGKSPQISHFVNVALFACVCALVVLLLQKLLAPFLKQFSLHLSNSNLLALLGGLIFAAHPTHTEVVANIKSRDELLALLFLSATLFLSLKWLETSSPKHLAAALGSFALALLSKESAVTFTPVLPLALYLHRANSINTGIPNNSTKTILTASGAFGVLAMAYLLVWFGIIGRVEDKLYFDTLNNPFANATFAERTATATLVLGVYLAKSLFPLTLSTGYTYNEFPLAQWSNPASILVAVILVAMLALGVWLLLRKHVLALCLLGWCCTMAIASNYFVYAGGLLGERFLFTPSLFAAIGLVWCIIACVQRFLPNNSVNNFRIAVAVCLILAGVYTAKTLVRSADWRTTETLLAADVVSTPNSIHLHRMYGGLLLQKTATAPRSDVGRLLKQAQEEFRAGIRVDSTLAPSLYNGIGNTFAVQRRYDSAIPYFNAALRLASQKFGEQNTLSTYRSNLANALTAQGVILFGMNTPESRNEALRAMQASAWLKPSDSAYSNLGAMFAAQSATKQNATDNNLDSAIFYLEKALALNPALQRARKNLAICYRKRGDTAQAARLLVP